MNNVSNSLTSLKAELNKLPELSGEQKEKLWLKFRLEWNYNSNHLEGNTLTYGQTKILLINEQAIGEKTMREYKEMEAHDFAIKYVQDEASIKEKPLTENFIRELNEIILVRPFWKEAQTIDGQNTRRLIEIGKYKKFPNSVRLQNGEIFHYAKPEEVAAKMEELVNWYNNEIELSPEDLAAYLHYRFVRIHPFDDGNGRVARLLMNYVLLKHNLPPVIIKSADKANYLLALNKADTGDIKAFADYITEQLKWSLQLHIKAANNESLEEPDDLDKEIELLKRNRKKESLEVQKTKEIIVSFTENFVVPFLEILEIKVKKFSELFMQSYVEIFLNGSYQENENKNILFLGFINREGSLDKITLRVCLNGYKNAGKHIFSINRDINLQFETYKVSISYLDFNQSYLYHQIISNNQQNQIANEIAKSILEEIKEKVG